MPHAMDLDLEGHDSSLQDIDDDVVQVEDQETAEDEATGAQNEL